MSCRSRNPIIMFAIIVVVAAGCAPPAISGGGYELVFEDNFDGTVLSPVWGTAHTGPVHPPVVSDGVLTLRTTRANESRWGYIASVGPRRDQEPNYPFASTWQEGYFEARMRFTRNPWAWPTFWLFSMARTEAWPDEDCSQLSAEWDIMENGIGNTEGDRPPHLSFYGVIHRNTTDGTSDGYCGIPDERVWVHQTYPNEDLSDWHIWAGRWAGDELCMYLDGVEIGCTPTYDSTAQPMHITLTIQYQTNCAGCPAQPAELRLQVDWVRVWQTS